MNREILEKAGFTKEMQLVENRQCPLCQDKIDIDDFNNDLSVREFIISGMCQKCQDRIFNEPEE